MESPLPLDCELVVEEGHQLQLAAPDRAPQRDAAQRLGLAAGQAPQQAAAPGHRFEFGLQLAEPLGRGALFGIGAKLARRDERVIGRKDGGHLLPLRIVPAKLSTIRSEEHTSELQSLMRISYAVFCLKKKTPHT